MSNLKVMSGLSAETSVSEEEFVSYVRDQVAYAVADLDRLEEIRIITRCQETLEELKCQDLYQ